MSREVRYYCDVCKKELHSQACATVTVFVHQGYNNPSSDLSMVFSRDNVAAWARAYWKHKEIYHKVLCKDCLGGYENVNFNHGDDPYFSMKDEALGLLRTIGIIK